MTKLISYRHIYSLLMLTFIVLQLLTPVYSKTSGEDRFSSVSKLVEVSSAAEKIHKSDNEVAKSKHNEARSLLKQAKSMQQQGNTKEADKYLTLATQTMFEAVRLVDKDQSIIDKQQRDYVMRLDSINALCQAYERIRDEKGLVPAKDSELYPFVQSKLKSARSEETQGNYIKGREILDEAYVAAKVAIEHIRGGDTLVRSLNFATSEEEYVYELDRNDTHKMLVDILLNEKMENNAGIKNMVTRHMSAATQLRQKAEAQAARGQHETAVKTLEQSTKEIVRAIRSAGIYIPG